MLNTKIFSFNPFSENTYIVWDEETKECAVIDPGCFYTEEETDIKQYIDSYKLTVKYLLATHLHLDHCFGCKFIAEHYNVKLSACSNDSKLLILMPEQAKMFGIQTNVSVPTIENDVKEGDEFKIGEYTFVAISVPGHSPGSIVYYCKLASIAFVGDVIFKEGIGRCDLPGGNYKILAEGIRSKLFTLPDNTIVYSGHGPTTTIGYEREYNPYI
ncbi:MAG: MBL fold metallo-hydrolase [Bacteroidales bacterium]